MSCQRRELLKLVQVSWQLGERHEDAGPEDSQSCLEEVRLAGTGEALSRHLACLSPRLLGCTVVEDSQGLFRKHREEELEERRSLYR